MNFPLPPEVPDFAKQYGALVEHQRIVEAARQDDADPYAGTKRVAREFAQTARLDTYIAIDYFRRELPKDMALVAAGKRFLNFKGLPG